jgi:coenzyme F420-reducing hydrogenase delta subunit
LRVVCERITLNSQFLSPAFQAVVDGGTLSTSCASLACGYENQALRAKKEMLREKEMLIENSVYKSPKVLIFITAGHRPAEHGDE